MTRAGLSRAIALALLAGVILVAFFLTSLPGETSAEEGSVRSGEPEGRLAAHLLLRELGLDPRPWREAPGRLPRGRTVLFLPARPADPPDYLLDIWAELDAEEEESGEAPSDEPRDAARRQRDPRHYRRFLEEGGVIVAGLDDDRRSFFEEELGLDLPPSPALDPPPERQTVATRRGETLSLDWSSLAGGERGGYIAVAPGWGRPLLADVERPLRAFAASVPVGRGELVLLADDRLLDNRALPAGDNALALVRLVEELEPFDGLYFDEYALGAFRPDSALALAVEPRSFPLTVHLLLCACLCVWWLAWAGPFPRDPEPLGLSTPAARARAQGALLARLGAFGELASALRRGVRAELPGAERRSLDAGEEDAAGRAERALAHLPLTEEERAAFTSALAPAPVASAEGLDRLARTLARLERLSRDRSRKHNPAL